MELNLANTPNVGMSSAQFLVVGTCVRAVPDSRNRNIKEGERAALLSFEKEANFRIFWLLPERVSFLLFFNVASTLWSLATARYPRFFLLFKTIISYGRC